VISVPGKANIFPTAGSRKKLIKLKWYRGKRKKEVGTQNLRQKSQTITHRWVANPLIYPAIRWNWGSNNELKDFGEVDVDDQRWLDRAHNRTKLIGEMGIESRWGKTDCHEQAEARREVANIGMKVESLF
jgi:hypothetical protein